MALSNVQQGKHRDALVVLDDLLQDVPDDESVLLLAAGCYAASGGYSRAMTTLDKALKVNPKRPDSYLNMAWLLLEMTPGKLDEPEMYYRQAVKLGGARDRDLERRLGIRPE
jgi:Tfp pilus assembly protein PilF